MSSVEIKNLNKYFDTQKVLHDISFTIPDGEFVALVGPSGCGKSTILRLLAGLEEITSGEILIDNNVINEVESKNRDIAMVFQNYALYPHMNVAENMGFSLRLLKKTKNEIFKKVSEVAEVLGISELLKRYPKQLSGGQRQRVAMGRAIVRQPKVFLFDEPLSNLDAKLRVQMRSELKDLHKRLKTTTIYVTHDQIEAMTMADKVIVLNEGKIEQIGKPLQLYDHPVNKFVAGFIGSPAMNFLDVTIPKGSNFIKFMDGQSLSISGSNDLEGDFFLGIRPEHFSTNQKLDGLLFNIISVEQTGSETFIQCELSGKNCNILLHSRLDINLYEKIKFTFDRGSLKLFDKVNGSHIPIKI
tara:strand:+ start:606 stop:1676 length:1071 start_codon:yes stop_codon:yes gene_type:complete